ncbi:MAG: hypothetical protein K8S54_10500 [Spirochaetia bacterium]|nr:hypothetical protein [Spirochaetia bacterium]
MKIRTSSLSGGAGNTIALTEAAYFLRNNDFIHYVRLRKLPDEGTTIILSATVDPWIYQCLYGDRVVVHDLGSVQPKGTLIQINRNSFSQASLGKLEKAEGAAKILRDFAEMNFRRISFQSLESDKIVLDSHFGATEGDNRFTGENLLVLGTQNIPEHSLRLRAASLGLETSTIKGYHSVQPCRVTYGSYEFRYMALSDDPDIQRIQFGFTKGQIEQAVGRARYYEYPSTVVLYSNFPLDTFTQWSTREEYVATEGEFVGTRRIIEKPEREVETSVPSGQRLLVLGKGIHPFRDIIKELIGNVPHPQLIPASVPA